MIELSIEPLVEPSHVPLFSRLKTKTTGSQ